ncbi:Monodictyphenone cluster transcription factor [Lasiodiplodia theobromae]|uniref:Monodictyphenone cluster transcription factor n=1 Tax=Lasiodiplodia theobromae TaxID=45133 RepID=A0A5N5D323_9PEZI|nr:Monodictyphenone cluster transcription factor [Lasiodiplodia theobromae]
MAETQSSDVSPRRRSTGAAGPKLRDSCDGCATSKLKCSKEKPVCARCAKRGMKCEYFATKRAGRKLGGRRGTNAANVPHTASTLPWSISTTDSLASPDAIQLSFLQHESTYPDILPDLLSAGSTASSTPGTLISQIDDFFASPISFFDTSDTANGTDCHPSAQDISSLLDQNGTSLLLQDDAFSAIDEVIPDLDTAFKPQTPPATQRSTSCNEFLSESPCCCLIRALSLFKQLFPNPSMSCSRSESRGSEKEDSADQFPTLEAVVRENERTIEAISSMLECTCSEDGYLLSIMSLIVLKVLGWYAAAARREARSDESRSLQKHHMEGLLKGPGAVVVGGSSDGEDDHRRIAAQTVLSELHRVQRLINALSHRLKGLRQRNGGRAQQQQHADGAGTDGHGGAFAFPTTMLDQFEVDLRKRLRDLSTGIVDMLRQE